MEVRGAIAEKILFGAPVVAEADEAAVDFEGNPCGKRNLIGFVIDDGRFLFSLID
jgi:hypothetical protein